MATVKTAIQLYDGVTSPLKSMTRAIEACVSSFESMKTTSASGVDTAKIIQAREALTTVAGQLETIERNIDKSEQEQRQFNSAIKDGSGAMGGLMSTVKNVALGIGAVLGIRKALDLSDVLTQTTARLNMMNDGLQTTEQLQNMIFASAQRSRGSYQATADAVSKMGIMARDAFTSNAELVAFAEQLNKQFTIAGTSREGIAAAMLQLTQAMGSGVLRGEELNSVFEQAPTIIQAIATHLNVPIGQIRNLAQEGELSAEVVKNALLASADETNRKFESMPKTIAQTWQSISNTAMMAFQPALAQISEIVNSANFAQFSKGVISNLQTIARLATKAFGVISRLGAVIYRNWATIVPILGAVTAGFVAYKAVALATTAIITAQKIALWAHSASQVASTSATFVATTAQYGLNTALYLCPVTWYVAGFLAIAGVLMAVATHFAKATGMANSFVGTVTGGVSALLAIFDNFEDAVKTNFYNIGVVFYNVFNKLRVDFYDLISMMISATAQVARVMSKIPGVKFDYEGLLANAEAYERKAIGYTMQYKDMRVPDWFKEAFQNGAQSGEDKIAKLLGRVPQGTSMDDFKDGLDGIYNNTLNTSIETQKIADNMSVLDDTLAYMVDIAEREAVNRFTTAEITIEQHNNNNISSTMDIDDVMSKWNESFTEVLQTASEGVHK